MRPKGKLCFPRKHFIQRQSKRGLRMMRGMGQNRAQIEGKGAGQNTSLIEGKGAGQNTAQIESKGAVQNTALSRADGGAKNEAAGKPEKPLIQVKHVRKIYRMGDEKVVALNDVSLDIYKGEIICFLGTSGSGKSTFLNMVAGLEKPTKGEIIIGGIPVHKLNEENVTLFRQKNIGFIFQAYHLMPMMTALENVSLPLIFGGMEKKKRERIAKKVMKSVGLEGYERRKPTQMSGGQQQRVGIARALVATPKIIFADEPTGNLDTHTTKEVMDLIVSQVKEHQQTLILVTHDRGIASYADKVVTIQDGDILSIEINPHPERLPAPDGGGTAGKEAGKPGEAKAAGKNSKTAEPGGIQAAGSGQEAGKRPEGVEEKPTKGSVKKGKGNMEERV